MGSSKRVLHLISSLHQGGAECQLAYLAEGLLRRGWDVHVGYLQEGAIRARLARCRATLHRVANAGSYDPRSPLRLRRLIRRLSPALVQTWIPMMDIIGGLAARAAGVPWILTERNTPDFFPNDAKARARRLIARGARAVVSNSSLGGAYWNARLPPNVGRFVIRNALPLGELAKAPDQPEDDLGLPEDRPIILYAGRLNEQKNIEVLLQALERAVRATPAVALLCGTDVTKGRVHAFLRERGLTHRVFASGFVPRVWPWMRRASVFVSVSRYEGMPNTVMEAAALGCPLVLSDIPHHRDILDPDAALFVRHDCPEDAAQGIIDTLHDPEGARRRAEAARRAMQRWSIEAAARQYAEVYEKVCG